MKYSNDVPLAEYTTFKIGGKAKYFCIVKSEEELKQALDYAKQKNLPVFILGGGSNILISDGGFAGLVIKMEMAGVSFEDDRITAWAGEGWDELVAKTVDWGVWGLENLSGIPGTVGAAPVQNIGAYGTEVKDSIIEVRAVDITDGSIKIFNNEQCKFSYRDSFFKTGEGKRYAITSVTFKLSKTAGPNLSYKDLRIYFSEKTSPSLSEIREAVIQIRKGKFPELSQTGTAGSFWKNPIISVSHFKELQAKHPNMPSFPFGNKVKVPLAWILDNVCSLKGYKKGSVGLWVNQPIVVVADPGASSADIEVLALEVSNVVKEATNIDIEREVQCIG